MVRLKGRISIWIVILLGFLLKTVFAESLSDIQKNKYDLVKSTEGGALNDTQNITQIIKGNFLGDGSEVVLIETESFDFIGPGIVGFYIVVKNGKVEKIYTRVYSEEFHFWKFPGRNEELLLVHDRQIIKHGGSIDDLYTCKLSKDKKGYYFECYNMLKPFYNWMVSNIPEVKEIADDFNTVRNIEVLKAYYIGTNPNQSEELVIDIKYEIENEELNFYKVFTRTIRLKTEDFYKLKKEKFRFID
ncbi:MAG: hypothetical protein ACP5F8_03640 [Candidatus Aenigmatarchaeota archaeon]